MRSSPDAHPSPSMQISFESSLRIIRERPLHTNALRALAGTHPLSYYPPAFEMTIAPIRRRKKRRNTIIRSYTRRHGPRNHLSFAPICRLQHIRSIPHAPPGTPVAPTQPPAPAAAKMPDSVYGVVKNRHPAIHSPVADEKRPHGTELRVAIPVDIAQRSSAQRGRRVCG
jgi:hypothetical protein